MPSTNAQVAFSLSLSFFALLASTASAPTQQSNIHSQQKPLSLSSSSSPSSNQITGLSSKCTFTLLHKQLASLPYRGIQQRFAKTQNYIQIPTLTDHANNIVIDIAASRPRKLSSSYVRIDETNVFAIGGLLDEEELAVHGKDGEDEVVFEIGELKWGSEGAGDGEAWCSVGEWEGRIEGGLGARERMMECAFPCEKFDEEEEESDRDENMEL